MILHQCASQASKTSLSVYQAPYLDLGDQPDHDTLLLLLFYVIEVTQAGAWFYYQPVWSFYIGPLL